MRNIIIGLVFLLSFGFVNGQEENNDDYKSVDSTAVLFKAKLLTISKYGIANREKIINYVDSQNAIFLNDPFDSFMFIKVDFGQPYTLSDGSIVLALGDCSYYIAYSIFDNRFYRLGGFEFNDIDEFIKDLIISEAYFGSQEDMDEEINLACMYENYMKNKVKNKKKPYTCFDNCSELIRYSNWGN